MEDAQLPAPEEGDGPSWSPVLVLPQPVRGSSPVNGPSLVVFLLEIWPPNISETGVDGINTI